MMESRYDTDDCHFWHFDESAYSVTLMLQTSEGGGACRSCGRVHLWSDAYEALPEDGRSCVPTVSVNDNVPIMSVTDTVPIRLRRLTSDMDGIVSVTDTARIRVLKLHSGTVPVLRVGQWYFLQQSAASHIYHAMPYPAGNFYAVPNTRREDGGLVCNSVQQDIAGKSL